MNQALDEAVIDHYGQKAHAVFPTPSGDEYSRQHFVKSLKYFLASKVSQGNKLAYEQHAKKKWEVDNGEAPGSYKDIRKAMESEPFFNFWSAMQRNSQEMMWKACQVSVERQLPELISAAQTSDRENNGGSLVLDPTLDIPRYHQAVDIHCMPGGYHTEFTADDVANGAVYDRAVYLYAMGRMGRLNSDIGDTTIAYLQKHFSDLRPSRILDMGCTVGHSTLPYVDAFPEAEVHAIDVGAPVLRYAHARAESLGKTVHFRQENAERTSYDDESFDLIVSHILVHETSHKAIRNIMRECMRLLKPGGIVIHAETPPYRDLPEYDAFMLDWDTRNNNEPFWEASHGIDPAKIAEEVGFDPQKAFEGYQPSAYEAAEAQRTNVFQGGDFAGGGAWYVWGVVKE